MDLPCQEERNHTVQDHLSKAQHVDVHQHHHKLSSIAFSDWYNCAGFKHGQINVTHANAAKATGPPTPLTEADSASTGMLL